MYFRFYGWCHVWPLWAVWRCVEVCTFRILLLAALRDRGGICCLWMPCSVTATAMMVTILNQCLSAHCHVYAQYVYQNAMHYSAKFSSFPHPPYGIGSHDSRRTGQKRSGQEAGARRVSDNAPGVKKMPSISDNETAKRKCVVHSEDRRWLDAMQLSRGLPHLDAVCLASSTWFTVICRVFLCAPLASLPPKHQQTLSYELLMNMKVSD